MNRIESFIIDLTNLKKELSFLEKKYNNVYSNYLGELFEGQDKCAFEIENLTLSLTHEVSSQMEFGINNLEDLVRYYDFRIKYYEYKDLELLQLLDNNDELNSLRRKDIINNKKEKNLSKIISDWNNTFNNLSFQKVKDNLRLD